MKKKILGGLIVLTSVSVFAYQNEFIDWPFSAPIINDADNDIPTSARSQGDIVFEFSSTSAGTFRGFDGTNWVSLSPASGTVNLASVDDTGSPLTLTNSNDVVLADASSGSITINLFTASGNAGKIITVKMTDVDASFSNSVTLDGHDSETIGGSLTNSLNTAGETLKIVSDGSNWHVLKREAFTDWSTYTSTLSSETSVSSKSTYFRRVGDTLEVHGIIAWNGVGGGSTFTVSLPTGLTIDTSKVSSVVQDSSLGMGQWRDEGTARKTVNVVYNGTTAVQFELHTGSPLLGTGFSNIDKLSFSFKVPISGWTSK